MAEASGPMIIVEQLVERCEVIIISKAEAEDRGGR